MNLPQKQGLLFAQLWNGENMSKGKINTELGEVKIKPDVIARFAGLQAVECFGIVGMAAISMTDGIVKLLKRESLTRGISVKVDKDNKLIINFHVIVAYGVSITAVSDNLIDTVKYKVEEFTGFPVKKIRIFVEGVRVID